MPHWVSVVIAYDVPVPILDYSVTDAEAEAFAKHSFLRSVIDDNQKAGFIPAGEYVFIDPQDPFFAVANEKRMWPLVLRDVSKAEYRERDGGGTFVHIPDTNLYTHRDASSRKVARKAITILDALVYMAASDALNAGRNNDANRLLSLIAPYHGTYLTDEQEAEVISHLWDEKPIVVKAPREVTALSGAHSKRNIRRSKDTGIEYTAAGVANDIILRSSSNTKLSVNAGTMLLLGQLLAIYTRDDLKPDKSGLITVRTSMDELLGDGQYGRGEKNETETRRTIRNQMSALASLQFSRDGEEGPEDGILVGDSWSAKNPRNVWFTFGHTFTSKIASKTAPQQPWDSQVWKIDYRAFPSAYPIYVRLESNMYMNHGKPNEFRLSVNSIIDGLKVIPSATRIKNRLHTERRIVPFEQALNHLVKRGLLKWWRYCHKNGAPLTDEEQAERDSRADGALPHKIATAMIGGESYTLIEWEPSNYYRGHMLNRSDRKRLKAADAVKAKEPVAEEQTIGKIINKSSDFYTSDDDKK